MGIVFKAFNHFLEDRGIKKQMFTPFMPQQYGVANGTIVKMARSIFYVQNLDKLFWAKVVVNAVYTGIVERKEALHCTHVCVCVRCLRNGTG